MGNRTKRLMPESFLLQSILFCSFFLSCTLCGQTCSERWGKMGDEIAMDDYAWVYIGTETKGSSEGIYASRLNLNTGKLDAPVLAAATGTPGFLTMDPSQRFLFCTGKPMGSGQPFNTVSGFAVDPKQGTLTAINGQAVEAMACCHISTSPDGSVLFAADYGHAKVATFPLSPDGRIGSPAQQIVYDTATQVVPGRQDAPHVHSINPDVSGRYVFVCDFSADAIKTYALDADAKTLTQVGSTPTAAGSGPRHLTCHPNGKWVYAIHELNGTITAMRFDADAPLLETVQTISTLPAGFTDDNTTAEIALSPDQRFLYGSNRGHDSIAYYSVDPATGLLSRIGIVSTEGQHPRNFTIDPTGRYMLVSNRDSDNVVLFELDTETGKPTFTGQQLHISRPMCIAMQHSP
jgi:6-phosphogluconolactonase